jgi:hypothetical protein
MEQMQKKRSGRFMVPGFLNRFDNWLLRKYPDIWSGRTHLLLWFALLVYSALFACYWIIPDDQRTRSSIEFWCLAAGLVSFIGMVVWLIYLFRFNVFKRYGHTTKLGRLRTFLQYFISVAMLASTPLFPLTMETLKADMVYGDDEIVEDVNNMNLYAGILEKENIEVEVFAETLFVVDDYYAASQLNSDLMSNYKIIDGQTYHERYYVDSSTVRWRIEGADSLEQINPKTFVITHFTNLKYIDAGRTTKHSDVEEWNSADLYRIIYLNKTNVPRAEAQKNLDALVKKYYHRSNDNSWAYNYAPYSNQLRDDIRSRYKLGAVDDGIYNIGRRKHSLSENDKDGMALALFYFTLLPTLLIFAFRHSTIAAFFFSLLTAVVLAILSGIIIVATDMDEDFALVIPIICYLAFMIVSLTIPASQKRSTIKGIALNMFFVITYSIPPLCVVIWNEWRRHDYYYYGPYDYSYEHNRFESALFASQFVSIGILLIMIPLVFAPLYRKWYAQPED